jgi:hypothetical protein
MSNNNENTQLVKTDDFFSDLENNKPYLKAAFQGFAGSGKTFTSAQIAVGLHQHIRSTKPVVIFDTETASKYLVPLFRDAKIKVVVKSSRSLADLKETMKRCREGYSDILFIDSITHVWEDLLKSYAARKKSTRLEFQDWGIIKPLWKTEFSDPFVRDPYHCIMTGRAGYEYSNEKNEETGRREIYKSGIKMKVEGETAYEPDILVLMERFEETLTDKKKVYREATILKDRSTLIDGKTFANPSFEDFKPAIEAILSDPAKNVKFEETDASSLIHTEENKREFIRQRDIALEKIESCLVKEWPGSTKEDKRFKVLALEHAFGTSSWTEVTSKHPNDLNVGIKKIEEYISTNKNKAEVTK